MKFASNNHRLVVYPIRSFAASAMFVCAAILSCCHAPLWGQEDPFGGATDPERPPAVRKSPAGADAEAAEAAAQQEEFDKKVAAETDPLVRTILQVKPTAPAQWMHDIQALLNLNRAEFAKEYLKQFLAAMPDAATLVQLQSRFGSAFFLRLSTTESLQPEGGAVANAVLQAASDHLRNAQRLAALVDRLSNEDAATRRLALVELVKAGAIAVPPIISVLSDTSRAAEHKGACAALVALGEEAIEPLIATLRSSDRDLRVQVIEVLEQLGAKAAVPSLLGAVLAPPGQPGSGEPEGTDGRVTAAAERMIAKVLGELPSRDAAQQFLAGRLNGYLAGTAPAQVDQADQVTVWVWDDAQKLLLQQTLPADDAAFFAAAQVAEQLHQIDPAAADHQQMYLATGLEVAKRLAGYDRPLTQQTGPIFQEASAVSTDVLENVLALALKRNMQGAAVAAIDQLGATANGELLKSSDGQPRLLARSLVSPIRRVQFAAAQAIMNIDPTQPYPGCSHLPEVLGYLSASGGRRRALIGDPRVETGQTLAGFFSTLGFDADSQQTGRSLILQAFASPDYSLVLIGDAVDHPRYREIVQTLRRDPRTADLPVGLMVREINEQSAALFARTDPLTIAFAAPQTQEDVEVDVRRLLALAGRRQVSDDERMRHATASLDALAKLASEPDKYAFYDLLNLDTPLQHALRMPSLATRAARVLGLLGTQLAQRSLVEFASTLMHPAVDRQAAAEAFRVAVGRRGLLLTRDQLLHQYELYNRSEVLDRDTQQVLATILDAIEEPTRTPAAPEKDN